ncbi:MAG: nuclear transport factor 2 family protein [Terracidiphilus sp.]|jgi:ketosteroid isomerase-like protein
MSSATLNAPTSAPASTDEAEILALAGAVHKAHLEKSPEGIAAPYAPHAVIYDLEPPLSHDGISVERKRKWLEGWDTPIELIAQDFKVTVSGDNAYGHGYLRMSGTPKAAGRPISFWMRSTMCFERIEGAWRIVHEHTSVPFYMDGSLRPAFDLQP